jgi:hypothetical protein
VKSQVRRRKRLPFSEKHGRREQRMCACGASATFSLEGSNKIYRFYGRGRAALCFSFSFSFSFSFFRKINFILF